MGLFKRKQGLPIEQYEQAFKELGRCLDKKGQVCKNLPEQKVQANLHKFIVEVSSDGELTIRRIHFGEFGEPHEVAEIYDANTTEQIYETLRDYYIELESEQIGKSLMDSIKRKETKK